MSVKRKRISELHRKIHMNERLRTYFMKIKKGKVQQYSVVVKREKENRMYANIYKNKWLTAN